MFRFSVLALILFILTVLNCFIIFSETKSDRVGETELSSPSSSCPHTELTSYLWRQRVGYERQKKILENRRKERLILEEKERKRLLEKEEEEGKKKKNGDEIDYDSRSVDEIVAKAMGVDISTTSSSATGENNDDNNNSMIIITDFITTILSPVVKFFEPVEILFWKTVMSNWFLGFPRSSSSSSKNSKGTQRLNFMNSCPSADVYHFPTVPHLILGFLILFFGIGSWLISRFSGKSTSGIRNKLTVEILLKNRFPTNCFINNNNNEPQEDLSSEQLQLISENKGENCGGIFLTNEEIQRVETRFGSSCSSNSSNLNLLLERIYDRFVSDDFEIYYVLKWTIRFFNSLVVVICGFTLYENWTTIAMWAMASPFLTLASWGSRFIVSVALGLISLVWWILGKVDRLLEDVERDKKQHQETLVMIHELARNQIIYRGTGKDPRRSIESDLGMKKDYEMRRIQESMSLSMSPTERNINNNNENSKKKSIEMKTSSSSNRRSVSKSVNFNSNTKSNSSSPLLLREDEKEKEEKNETRRRNNRKQTKSPSPLPPSRNENNNETYTNASEKAKSTSQGRFLSRGSGKTVSE